MAYVGNAPTSSIDVRDKFAGDGTTLNFTLSRRISGIGGILVVVSGVVQDSSTYAVLVNTLTFTQAPPAPVSGVSTNIEVIYLQTTTGPQSANWTLPVAANSGTADAISATYTPAVGSLTNNLVLRVVLADGTSNTTTTPTFNPSGLGARGIVDFDGSAVAVGQLKGSFELIYHAASVSWRIATNSSFVRNAGTATTATSATTAGSATTATNSTNSTNLTGSGTISDTTTVAGTGQKVGYRSIPANVQTAPWTLALTDAGGSVDTTANVTVPLSSSVAFNVGDTVVITNVSASAITIVQAASVVLRWAGTTSVGSRTLSGFGQVTLRKVATDTWFLTGAGVT